MAAGGSVGGGTPYVYLAEVLAEVGVCVGGWGGNRPRGVRWINHVAVPDPVCLPLEAP